MRNRNQNIKEAAQFWSKFLKEKFTTGYDKALGVDSGDLITKIKFGKILEDGMIKMRQEAAPAVDKFEAILIGILQEIIQSPQEIQTRKYVDFLSCETMSYSLLVVGNIRLEHDYQPCNILREALHRTSLETGIDLVIIAPFLLPFKTTTWLEMVDKSYTIDVNEIYNLPTQNNEHCKYLRSIRVAERKKQLAEADAHAAPPSLTMQEKLLLSAKNGAAHGLLRGSTQLLNHILKKKNISANAANMVSQAVYYSGIFSISLAGQSQEITGFNSFLTSMYHAALETGQIMIINEGLTLFTRLLENASHAASTNQWMLVSNILGKCSSVIQYSIFAKHAAEHGVATTSVSLGAGVAAQVIVERTGKSLIS